jgi:hypothetical protein
MTAYAAIRTLEYTQLFRIQLMKKILVLITATFTIAFANAQNGGWREKEMEIKVNIQNKEDGKILQDLHLNGEMYATYGLMDVIPSELEKIKSSGLPYEIVRENLNEFYKDFWTKKSSSKSMADKYHTYEEIIALIDSLASALPDICKKISFGTSVQSRQLCCLKISDNVNTDENEAEILLDGGIHGDEIGGAENVIRFARYLCSNYTKNADITTLINNREIWIYPMINPDGRVNMTRSNANQVDLNRDCGYMWNAEGSSKSAFSQIETKAIRDCMYNNQFVIHLNGHSGSENVFYPWCHRPAHAPDYTQLNTLAGIYSSSSKYASLVYKQSNADYATTGEVDDCSYGINGTMGMVLEISTDKQPSETEMITYYQNNVPAMMALLQNAGYGIEGMITDSITGDPVAAVLYVDKLYPFYSDPVVGDYHRFLLPGTYSIKVMANGYQTKTISSIVADKKSTLTDIKLKPLKNKNHYIYKIVSAIIPGNNPADEGNTPAVIGSPDHISYSIGKGGTIIMDFQYPVKDIQGKDIRVIEGDSSPEGFTCYAGQSMDGPWKLLGTGNGTSDFDLSAGSLQSAQFIKIVDDGDGTANVNDAGFDLDAVQTLDSMITGVPEVIASQLNFSVYPNPFTNSINIEYTTEAAETIHVSIYNVLGERVMDVMNKETAGGKHTFPLDASGLTPGIYYCKLESGRKLAVSTYIIKI